MPEISGNDHAYFYHECDLERDARENPNEEEEAYERYIQDELDRYDGDEWIQEENTDA